MPLGGCSQPSVVSAVDRTLADGLRFEREESPGTAPDMAERVANFGKK